MKPSDELISFAGQVLEKKLGRPVNVREARECVEQLWRFFEVLRDIEEGSEEKPESHEAA